MNILIPDSWLKEYLDSKATPKQIAQYLSLCSQSVEKIVKVGDDWVYDIEVTTNRPDCLSVYGIARELAAILPRFGIQAKLRPITTYQLPITQKGLSLEVKITNPSLCPRFTAIILDNITIKPSPKLVKGRLEKCGIRSLNTVVDISNYLMLELGQPMHTFDWDKIKKAKMILRESKKGEKIKTLDGQMRNLPDKSIIIEDGEGRIIDLCGIMGGENSAVSQNTKNVLLFIQTYNPIRIRRTCQQLAFRTEASSRFEKGVDPEGVIPAMKKAILMFQENCNAHVASKLIDIYSNPSKRKKIKLDFGLVEKIIGVKIPKNEVLGILKSLGFTIFDSKFSNLDCVVPHWRDGDISIPEDLVEEIARIYGYYQLPNILPPGKPPQEQKNQSFFWEERLKNALKYYGFTEIVNYSMTSEDLLSKVGLDPKNYLKITNPLTSELVYMRPTLIPSILEAIMQNQANSEIIKIFEIANIYIPQGKQNLPDEISMLTGAQTGKKFLEIKGIIETLFDEMGINDCKFEKLTIPNKIFESTKTATVFIKNRPIGFLGEIHTQILSRFEIKNAVTFFDLELNPLIQHATELKKFTPIPEFPPIIEDLAFTVPPKTQIGDLIQLAKSVSSIIKSVKLLDSYEDTRTFRITYLHPQKTLADREVKTIREKIIMLMEKKFRVKIKTD